MESEESRQNMPQSCTILCPSDESERILGLVREIIGERGTVTVTHDQLPWSSIAIEESSVSLVLNRLVQLTPGDKFSRLVLGMLSYFDCVKTERDATKSEILRRVEEMSLAIGVVAEPEFVEAAGHFDCIFGLADALDAVIWNGSGMLNSKGEMLLDGEGHSDVEL